MKRLLLVTFAFLMAAPITLAQPLEPPKNPGKPPEFFKARREALAARKQSQKDRMRQFKADRAAADEKAYQEWHERYLADTPVRVEYYRALASAYEADAALAYRTPYYYSAGPPVILPVIYVPAYYEAPIYGRVFHWGW
jgi:hypothetical protein